MALDGWFPSWFEASYFPPVWFAPGDETQVPVEELRLEYHGGGPTRPGRGQFADASDSDLERLVRDKWEAIEAANAKDATPDVAPATPKVAAAQIPLDNEQPAAPVPEPMGQATRSLLAKRSMDAETARLAAQAKAISQKRSNDAAMLLILAEL